MNLNREITRLKSICASSIVQEFKEGIEGASTIKVYKKYDQIFDKYILSVNEYQKNNVCSAGASNWFNVRVAILALLVIIPTVFISVIAYNIFPFG